MPDRTLRLFVALYPPDESRRVLLRALRKLSPPPDARHRETPIEHLHMTVHFIGETRDSELGGVTESIRRSAAGVGPFLLAPIKLVTLPERGVPRLIAAVTDSPAQLLEVQRRLVQRLARNPRARSGGRFLPHLTVCRFMGSANPKPVDEPIRIDPFTVTSLSLMQSTLHSDGASHEELVRIELA